MSRSSSRSSINNEFLNFPKSSSDKIPMTENSTTNNDLTSSYPFPQSLLSARRPSWTPSLTFRDAASDGGSTVEDAGKASSPSSPEDGGNFRRSLQIDNKGLVGDAVGNMSISPSSRDVVLAARRGLFIIDLESPLEVPRFLPQGGTWDVADVQWNPHPSNAKFIVSTSSEKLLIWNLLIVGKTSIQHILHSHYRAITDINWHTTEPDTVVSTGIDSWLWSWDLRAPEKPVFGLCAFNSGGTQVKWNRQDANILASSHLNEVLIWDRRKGSLPVSRIKAHNSKIYGIDWSHERRNEIVTCSLDKTIKVWDVDASPWESDGQFVHVPKTIIETHYPVWRARDLPFGKGVLSLPQRGETALEMFAYGDGGLQQSPVEVFEGHTDAVKEFVWRKGGRNGNEYQLITWSKDKTLRFWPVDSEIMQKVGCIPEEAICRPKLSPNANRSFRVPPEGSTSQPTISAPVGHRGILAEVRAPFPPQLPNPVLHPHYGSAARARSHEGSTAPPQNQSTKTVAVPGSARHGWTMSRGNIGGKSATIEVITWMKSVKEVSRKEGSSGPGSGADSVNGSRFSSRSRTDSDGERKDWDSGERSESGNRAGDEQKEKDNQSLQSEITSVIAKLEPLAQSKIRLEKHDLTKKRTCTLGLYGPWGGSSSVFIRVSFTFPKDYPQATHPHGTPILELERSPLVSIRSRVFMLRRLKAIRESRRPCLEPCLRFLLFGSEDEKGGPGRVPLDSDSSDEEGKPATRKSRKFSITLLRSHKNLAEPRTSQGVFGPNGDLICFFRAPPRIVPNPLRDISVSSDLASHPRESVPRLFQSPALLSDAVRRLALAATDRSVAAVDLRKIDDGPDNILRIMTNLLTFSQQKHRREPETKPLDAVPENWSLIPNRRNTVYIRRVDVARADKRVAREYVFKSKTLSSLCEENAKIATANMRYDHARIFMVLQSLFPTSGKSDAATLSSGFGSLAHQIVTRLYAECSLKKDLQMLAMASTILLQACRASPTPERKSIDSKGNFPTPLTSASKFPGDEYFSFSRRKEANHPPPIMPTDWPHLPISPTTPAAAAISSSNSSRPWSSLFNTGSVRQFMSGVQDTLKDGLSAPTSDPITHGASIPVPVVKKIPPMTTSSRHGRDPSIHSTSSIPRSWGDNSVPNSPKGTIAFSTARHIRRSTFSQITNSRITIPEKKILVFDELTEESNDESVFFDPQLMKQFVGHVLVYADLLFRWQLFHKRVELLKSVNSEVQKIASPHVSSGLGLAGLGVVATCERCGRVLGPNDRICLNCTNRFKMPQCSICRLPVKGLSRTCSGCLHVTHFNCWRSTKVQFCPTGCGCMCVELEMDNVQQVLPRLVQSPHSVTSVLPRT